MHHLAKLPSCGFLPFYGHSLSLLYYVPQRGEKKWKRNVLLESSWGPRERRINFLLQLITSCHLRVLAEVGTEKQLPQRERETFNPKILCSGTNWSLFSVHCMLCGGELMMLLSLFLYPNSSVLFHPSTHSAASSGMFTHFLSFSRFTTLR